MTLLRGNALISHCIMRGFPLAMIDEAERILARYPGVSRELCALRRRAFLRALKRRATASDSIRR